MPARKCAVIDFIGLYQVIFVDSGSTKLSMFTIVELLS